MTGPHLVTVAPLVNIHVIYLCSDNPGQPSCTPCPAGYYCTENSTLFAQQFCPAGYYCPAGTTDPYQNPCPMGTYNPVNGSDDATDCLSCPPGQYCQSKECILIQMLSEFRLSVGFNHIFGPQWIVCLSICMFMCPLVLNMIDWCRKVTMVMKKLLPPHVPC